MSGSDTGPDRGTIPARPARAGPGVAAALALALSLLPALGSADDSDLCILAAQDASRLSGVPLSVLMAVSLTETGRGQGGDARPWPWTVNMEGEGHWFATREEALAFAEAHHARGATSFDLGCFQVNWRWHGENFVSIEQMFDPLAGASYAARFLGELHAETGSWPAAAGAYHSRTPEHAARYRGIFESHLATLVAAGADEGRLEGPLALSELQVAEAGSEDLLAPRENWFPLLKAPEGGVAAPRLGSLVPLDG